MNNSKNHNITILPEAYQYPWLWVLFFVLPEILLCFLNGYGISLIWVDLSAQQTAVGINLFSSLILLIVVNAFIGVYGILKKYFPGSLIVHLGVLFAQIAYLWYFTANFDTWMKANVPQWIFSSNYFIYYQYLLILPGVFINLTQIAGKPLGLGRKVDLLVSLGGTILLPLTFYLVFQLFNSLSQGLASFFLVLLYVSVAIILLTFAIRVILLIFSWYPKNDGWRLVILKILAGWVFPFTGLWVNAQIPFPVDFQSPLIYLLTFVNGLFLVLPYKEGTRSGSIVWFMRCLIYPYAVYFFIIFLPFVPLSIPLFAAMGSGILILAPSILFSVQTRLLAATTCSERKFRGKKSVCITMLVAIFLVPGIYTGFSLLEKSVLMQGIQYVFEPDYQVDKEFKGNRVVLKLALDKLRRYKNGVHMPLISPYYNWLVFDGMVLPDKKIAIMYKTFLGREPDKLNKTSGIWGRERVRGASLREGAWNRPSSEGVEIKSIEVDEVPEGKFVRARIQLKMEHMGSRDLAQFEAQIRIPEGVLVSGYWLKVGHKKVPGRIFEKKTAMWVYDQITRTPKDPGLLIYESATELRLRVYPFSSGHVRENEIEFYYPRNWKPTIQIGKEVVPLREVSETHRAPLRIKGENDSYWITVPGDILSELPSIKRVPYFHFIVDCSQGTDPLTTEIEKDIEQIMGDNSSVNEFMLTLANYEFQDITSQPISFSEFKEIHSPLKVKSSKGGFLAERAIKRALLDYQNAIINHPVDWALRVPVFVVLNRSLMPCVGVDDHMSYFSSFTPEVEGYYMREVLSSDWTRVSFANGARHEINTRNFNLDPVIFLRSGQDCKVFRSGENIVPGIFEISGDAFPLEVFHGKAGDIRSATIDVSSVTESDYGPGLDLWRQSVDMFRKPCHQDTRMKDLVKKSREQGIMIPKTSMIVVESQSQWNILKRKEKQALGANQTLEFEEDTLEAPAPGIWILFPFLFLLMKRRKRQTIRIPRMRTVI